MRVRVGTSGFSYPEWKGDFYTDDCTAADMIAQYATKLPAVEINSTFYRMPKRSVVAGWAEKTPEDFVVCLKASVRITHKKKLENAEEDVAFFVRSASELGPRLGPTLFQTAPWMRKDVDRLRAFLPALPAGFRAAFEFRHESWHDDEVATVLREAGAAFVGADRKDGSGSPLMASSPFGYVRLHRLAYTPDELDLWAERVRAQPWDEAYVFFKHDPGPGFAVAFQERMR
jgi:uncharacterized protein YecE (DUF72 family)